MTAVQEIEGLIAKIKSPGEMETLQQLVRLAAEKLNPGLSKKQREAKAKEFIKNGGLKTFKQFQ